MEDAEREKVLHRFGCTGTGTEFFELVFTSNRMIIARTGGRPYLTLGQMQQEAKKSEKKEAELQRLSPEEILGDNPLNVSVPYSEIVSIEMKRPGFTGVGNIKIEVRDTKNRYEFRKAEKREAFQARTDHLCSILGSKVMVK